MIRPRAVLAATAFAAAACGESLGLPTAQVENVLDTVTVYALHGTPIGTASAYDVASGYPVRLELGQPFDFVFDIDSTGTAVLIPSSLLGVTTAAGLLRPDKAFADLDRAPLDGYVTDSIFPLTDGSTFVARSRASQLYCSYLGSLPRYGKFRVMELNAAERWVRLETLVNLNCGYRNLEEGVPTS